MSEVLIGTIVGGVIASVSPFAMLAFNYFQWKREKQIEHLRSQRDKLATGFQDAIHHLADGMCNNRYPTDTITDFVFLFPQKVSQAFDNMMSEKDKTSDNLRRHYFIISAAMKIALAEIDKKIEQVVS